MFDVIDRVNHHTKALQDVADRIHLERDLVVSAPETVVAIAHSAPEGVLEAARSEPDAEATRMACGDCPSEPARGSRAA